MICSLGDSVSQIALMQFMCPITSYRASLTLSSTRARASDSLYSLWVHIGEASSLGGCVEFGNPKIKNHLREGWWLWLLYINISTTPNSGGSSKADKMVSFPRQPHISFQQFWGVGLSICAYNFIIMVWGIEWSYLLPSLTKFFNLQNSLYIQAWIPIWKR